jgi:hypothetical protein
VVVTVIMKYCNLYYKDMVIRAASKYTESFIFYLHTRYK